MRLLVFSNSEKFFLKKVKPLVWTKISHVAGRFSQGQNVHDHLSISYGTET